MSDAPIEIGKGWNVVSIGDLRVSRGFTRRPHTSCSHLNLSYDASERRIWCHDCEREIEPFEAFLKMAEHYDRAEDDLRRRRRQIKEAEEHELRSLAAREIDKAWRSRDMAPACPTCFAALLPEDFKRGCSMINKEFGRKMRDKRRAEQRQKKEER